MLFDLLSAELPTRPLTKDYFHFLDGQWQGPVADPENFGGGGFEAQNLKNSDVVTKIESNFLAEIGNSNVFFAQIQVVSKKK